MFQLPLDRRRPETYGRVTRNMFHSLRSDVDRNIVVDQSFTLPWTGSTALDYGDSVALSPTSRRNFLRIAAGGVATAGLAACGGTSGPSSGSSSSSATSASSAASGSSAAGGSGGAVKGTATYWTLSGQPGEKIRKDTVQRWNAANPDAQITISVFQNDAYKTKIKTALGAGQGPTVIWGWGGGGLKSFSDAGLVEDLTSWIAANPALKAKLFPSSFGAATIGGKIYAMPAETVQPIVMYYNKQVFDKVGVKPPTTWAETMALVPKFNAAGIAPFSLGGQSRWTNMMWLEFLFDRIGGSQVFEAIFNGEKNGWSNPASIEALTQLQTLVKAQGFIKGFSSITADSNADQALLYTGKAAMMLHGSWVYGAIKDANPGFVSAGNLGYMNFPIVEGGKGDPTDTVGNPGQYVSINAKASDAEKAIAKKFFTDAILSEAEVKEWVDNGNIPIVKGSDSLLGASKDAAWQQFQYKVASGAKVFAQSWDQALSPASAEVLLDNISKLFQLSITPQQFATNMNQVIGK